MDLQSTRDRDEWQVLEVQPQFFQELWHHLEAYTLWLLFYAVSQPVDLI